MIQLGPTMPPCRRCKAAPGDDCVTTWKEVKNAPIPAFATGKVRTPHSIRVRDARRMSELLDL